MSSKLIREFWDWCELHRAGSATTAECARMWLAEQAAQGKSVTSEMLYAILASRPGHELTQYATPLGLNRFIARLAAKHPAESVLDPVCGMGLMLNELVTANPAAVVHGIELDAGTAEAANALLGSRGHVFHGDAMTFEKGLQDYYDLVVAHPPFGVKVEARVPHEQSTRLVRLDLAHAIVLQSAARLSPTGRGLFIVPFRIAQTCCESDTLGQLNKFQGVAVRAMIHLPQGAIPDVRITAYLMVVEKGVQGRVFVGQYADDRDHQDALVANLIAASDGPSVGLGQWVGVEAFRGFEPLAALERYRLIAADSGYQEADHVVIGMTRTGPNELPLWGALENRVFVSLRGDLRAQLEPPTDDAGNMLPCACLALSATRVSAPYFVHWFNETLMGRSAAACLLQDGTRAQLAYERVQGFPFCFPELMEQHGILALLQKLKRVRAQVGEVEAALLAHHERLGEIKKLVDVMDHADNYEAWIETLPFPLASILWRHFAAENDPRAKYEILLHFFEAVAAFVATVHLSAFMAEDELWVEVRDSLARALSSGNVSLERASFGAWCAIIDNLSAQVRKRRNQEQWAGIIERVYGTADARHVEMLCHPEMMAILRHANRLRNTTWGHAGAMSREASEQVHEVLWGRVHDLRAIWGSVWSDYELIQPSEASYSRGEYRYRARRVMGSRSTPFPSVERIANMPLESERLYLFERLGRRGLLLQPLVKIMPSPEKKAVACFIFNRRESAGARYVSYHFEAESSVTAPDAQIDEILSQLTSAKQ